MCISDFVGAGPRCRCLQHNSRAAGSTDGAILGLVAKHLGHWFPFSTDGLFPGCLEPGTCTGTQWFYLSPSVPHQLCWLNHTAAGGSRSVCRKGVRAPPIAPLPPAPGAHRPGRQRQAGAAAGPVFIYAHHFLPNSSAFLPSFYHLWINTQELAQGMRFLSHQATADQKVRCPRRTVAPGPPKSCCESLTMSLFAATTTANSQESYSRLFILPC